MRVVKDRASGLLQAEAQMLATQVSRCRAQQSKLAGLGLAGLSGQSVSAAERNVHMQAAIVTAHLGFFQALQAADREGIRLVSSLPVTSPGVLDTAVAEERAERARSNIRDLEARMEFDVAQAQRINDMLFTLYVGVPAAPTIDIGSIQSLYQTLITSQYAIIATNEHVLEQAHEFERAMQALYSSVDTSHATSALKSSQEFGRTGSWGPTAWVSQMQIHRALEAKSRMLAYAPTDPSLAEKFFAGDLKGETTWAQGSIAGSIVVLGATAQGKASGDVGSMSFSAVPNIPDINDLAGYDWKKGVGVDAEIEAHGASGEVEGSLGDIAHGSAEGKVLTGAVSGSVGATLFTDGEMDPSAHVQGEISGKVAEAEASGKVGVEDFNAHASATGEAFVATAEIGATLSREGIETKVGAEAYAAQGKISGGLTLLGAKLDATVTIGAVGAGAKAAAAVTKKYAEGEIGLGLGIGASVKVKVDWSGLPAAALRALRNIRAWWDSL